MSSLDEYIVAGIPAFNEERNIAAVILRSLNFVDQVIVCDDGSHDLTGKIAEKLGAHVIRHEKNKGYGSALQSIFYEAVNHGVDIIVTLDGDGQHDPAKIPELVTALKDSDAEIVIGSRFLEGESETPVWRSRGIKVISELTSNHSLNITDAQSGFRAYTKKAIESLKLTEEGMGISTEILVKAQDNNMKIIEVPIKISYAEDSSTYQLVPHGIKVLLSTIKHLSLRHPLLSYGVPGAISLFVAAFFWIWTLQIFSVEKRVVTNLALVALGSTLIGLILSTTAIILWVLVTLIRERL